VYEAPSTHGETQRVRRLMCTNDSAEADVESGMIQARDRLIFALDIPTLDEAEHYIALLSPQISTFKIGLELQMAAGSAWIASLSKRDVKIFLDYKYFDIDETVRRAVAQAVAAGVCFLTVQGYEKVVRAAVSGRPPSSRAQILAVTVLTSLDVNDMERMGFPCAVEEVVLHRAKLAYAAGCDGVVASAQEANTLRTQIRPLPARAPLLIITPGIRPAGSYEADQKRTSTPREAILAGADYLVVGRPIRDAVSPQEATTKILHEMQQAFDQRMNRVEDVLS